MENRNASPAVPTRPPAADWSAAEVSVTRAGAAATRGSHRRQTMTPSVVSSGAPSGPLM